jgi:hypothetical protein
MSGFDGTHEYGTSWQGAMDQADEKRKSRKKKPVSRVDDLQAAREHPERRGNTIVLLDAIPDLLAVVRAAHEMVIEATNADAIPSFELFNSLKEVLDKFEKGGAGIDN